MLLDQARYDATDADAYDGGTAYTIEPEQPRWTVVLPFHNERDYLPVSLRSLAEQTMPFHLILVDNGSTDGSGDIAMALCHLGGIRATLLTERSPGKVSALQCGIEAATSELIATCDADTIYPEDYLARATDLLDRAGTVAAVAATAPPEATPFDRRLAGAHIALAAKLLPQQCHNGGAGQVFRADALKAAGGFDPRIWNWVLEDHEIMARVERRGRIAYHRGFQCAPITRPRSASTVGWGLAERLRYHASTTATRQAFFHDFLGPRLRERALSSERLRRDAPYREESKGLVELYPVRG
ncbi:MAG TPA: glycosyltransferase family A protein [Sphingobium sp.]|uniref:glycosyltransferase family 2 protein n=1 Tax=Sphingobium sp. TaxID=1912891 RepID=UPI002ED0CB1D